MAVVEDTRKEVNATAKFVRTAPRKAQLVVAEIRGRSVAEARTMLKFMPRAAARDVEKVLDSAVANAEANHDLSGDDLFVSAAYVGSGPTLKRWRARARGRVGRIKKRTCHITIRVAPVAGARPTRPPVVAPPAPRRARRPKDEATPGAADAAAPAPPAAADVGAGLGPPGEAEPAEPVPRKKATPPAAPAAETAPEDTPRAPRPARARKAAPKTEDAAPAEKPKRAPRKRAAKPDGEEK